METQREFAYLIHKLPPIALFTNSITARFNVKNAIQIQTMTLSKLFKTEFLFLNVFLINNQFNTAPIILSS